jgi:spore coat protein U-like protein
MRISAIVLLLCLSSLAWPVNRAEAFQCDVTATGLNFGSYDVFSPEPLESQAEIKVYCNNPEQNPHDPLVYLSPGNSGNFARRSMKSLTSSDQLDYNLYTDAFMSTIWGDGNGGSSAKTALVNKDMQPWTAKIYGRIPARQNVRAGSYSDTITVTIDF